MLFFSLLRAPDRKYQKSHDRSEISDFILFHLNVPFGELFSIRCQNTGITQDALRYPSPRSNRKFALLEIILEIF